MDITPGFGIDDVRIGEPRSAVESRLGDGSGAGSRVYYDPPGVLVQYDADELVELIEIPYRLDGRSQPSLDGVPLTYRFMDEVVQDLAARGHAGHPSDIGYDFEAGFAVFSMASLAPSELDPAADREDERLIVEGVSVAPFAYFVRNR